MKYHLHKIKTASNAIAVQVIKYQNRKRVVVKQIGSAHSKDQLLILLNNANNLIEEQTKQISLFPEKEQFIEFDKCEYL